MNDEFFLGAELAIDVQAAAGKSSKPAKVSILLYSGGLMRVPGQGPLVVDLAGMKLPADVSILVDHNTKLDGIVGRGIPAVRSGQLFVEGTISRATDAGRQILALAGEGHTFQASVGALIQQRKFIQPGETIEANGRQIRADRDGFYLVTQSELKEATITAIGADATTKVSIAASQKGQTMPEETTTNPPSTDPNPILANQQMAERERVLAIDETCRDLPGLAPERLEQLRANAIRSGTSVDQFNSDVLDLLRSSRSTAPAVHSSGPAIHDGSRRHAATTDMLTAALLTRAGFESLAEKEYGDRVMASAGSLVRASFVDLCRASLELEGHSVPSSSRDGMIRAAASTYSLPVALGDSMNKVLMQSYTEAPATWRAFCKVKPAANFKEQQGIRPSFTRPLDLVGNDGEVPHGSISESTFPWSIDTYGKRLVVTRQDVINDDLNFLDEVAPLMSKAALRRLSDLVYTRLLAATSAYFDAALGNAGTAALDVTSLGAGITAMRNQRDDEDNDLDIMPRTLLLPPELESTGKAALESEFTERIATANDVDDVRPTGNPQRGAVKLEVESRLSNTEKFEDASLTGWYLFGAPQDAPLIVGFLDGIETPTSEFFGLEHDSKHLAMTFRVFHDFGCALADHRAAYHSTGGG